MSNPYIGVDWGGPLSTDNRDRVTGIRYGIIQPNSIHPERLESIQDASEDLRYEAAVKDMQSQIMHALQLDSEEERWSRLSDILDQFTSAGVRDSIIEDFKGEDRFISRESAWSIVEEDFDECYNDRSNEGVRSWRYRKDGYTLLGGGDTICVQKSPYFTYVRFCSPCYPGAGDLDSPIEGFKCPYCGKMEFGYFFGDNGIEDSDWGVMMGCKACGSWRTPDWGNGVPPRTYCLGHDFFEGEEAPYPVFNLETGKRVFVVEEKKQCPTCHGKGRRTLQELAACRHRTLEQLKEDIDTRHVMLEDLREDTFNCHRCGGLGYEMEKVEVEK